MKFTVSLTGDKDPADKKAPLEGERTLEAQFHDQNLRTEYQAVCQFYSQVVTLRFTAASIFVVAVSFILRESNLDQSRAVLLLLVGLGMWAVEIRNRGIYNCIAERAMQIEGDWGYTGRRAYQSFFRRMFKPELKPQDKKRNFSRICPDPEAPDKPPPDDLRLFFWKVTPSRFGRYLFSHTLGLDLIYSGVISFALWHLGLDAWIRFFSYSVLTWFFPDLNVLAENPAQSLWHP